MIILRGKHGNDDASVRFVIEKVVQMTDAVRPTPHPSGCAAHLPLRRGRLGVADSSVFSKLYEESLRSIAKLNRLLL